MISSAERHRTFRERRKAKGLCPECKGPNDSDFYRCFKCRELQALKRQQTRNAEKYCKSEAHDNG